MNYRTFGRTGWQVSEITFGAWQLGGTWGVVDERESIDTLLYAFEKGINLVDTAVLYGNGKSESTIGKALRQWRGNRIFVATKVPPLGVGAGHDSGISIKGCYPEHHVRENERPRCCDLVSIASTCCSCTSGSKTGSRNLSGSKGY